MHGVLQRRWEQSGPDEQERLMLSFDKMFAREKNTQLGILFSYWQEKNFAHSVIPGTEDFLYRTTLSDDVNRFICWADASSADPFNFIMRDHANLTGCTDHSNRRLGDHPSRMNAVACASEYFHCIVNRVPVYHEINQKIGNMRRHYFRLMLPIAGTKGRITRLVYAVRVANVSRDSEPDESSRAI